MPKTLPDALCVALAKHLPPVMRWSGALARLLRKHNIRVEGAKTSGSALTDALTLADLSLQELLVAALRDADPIFRQCRIEAEEKTGDLERFATNSDWTIALDPIDGTKQFRDHTGNGYAVMAHLRNASQVVYSLVYIPEKGPHGWWVEVSPSGIKSGADDPEQSARAVLDELPFTLAGRATLSKKIYLIGFQQRDITAAQQVTKAGLEGVAPDDMPGSIYQLLADGEFVGSLIHSPNIYDFPVSLQIARQLGGDAVWVHNGESVHFGEMWMDDRADMLRLPGVVACSPQKEVLKVLVQLAQKWHQDRYHPHTEL